METIKQNQDFSEIAKNNFKMWNDSLKTGDAKKVAQFYVDGATFLPTMSGDFKHGQEGAEGYFEHFLLKNPSGTIIEEKVQPISENSYLSSGLYDFEVGQKDKREIVEARFTYVWQKDGDGQWKILHHHSSVKPK